MTEDGKVIHASELVLGSLIRSTAHDVMPVVQRETFTEHAHKVILGIAAPHWFLLTPAGPVIHNGSVKP
jgi:hypothetical protein